MKLVFAFLSSRKRYFFAFGIAFLIFMATFLLYGFPVESILYPTFLCALLAFLWAVFSFLRFRDKHKTLSELARNGLLSAEQFPEPECQLETDYQEILENVLSSVAELENQAAVRYQDTVEYFTVWAHQIKTPIAVMRLNLQNKDTPEARRLLSEVLRIEQYVEMVLTYLRLGSESTDYVFREYALDELLRQAVRRFASEFIGRKIRLEFTPTEHKLITDGKWLGFVLEQLLSNALKYTAPGGMIRIVLREDRVLSIEDTGIGIAPEDLPRIFEKGYTGCNGRNGGKASGIGLYLCKQICTRLGIGIQVESVPDKGTTVLLNLAQYQGRPE